MYYRLTSQEILTKRKLYLLHVSHVFSGPLVLEVVVMGDSLLGARFVHKGFVKHKQVKISDKKAQHFGDIVTPFSSSNAKR